MNKKWIAILIATVLPMMAWSQFSISGKVMDAKTGEKLAGAHLMLNNSYKALISDTEGKFSISR